MERMPTPIQAPAAEEPQNQKEGSVDNMNYFEGDIEARSKRIGGEITEKLKDLYGKLARRKIDIDGFKKEFSRIAEETLENNLTRDGDTEERVKQLWDEAMK